MQLIKREAGRVEREGGREGGAAHVGRLCSCMSIPTGPLSGLKASWWGYKNSWHIWLAMLYRKREINCPN